MTQHLVVFWKEQLEAVLGGTKVIDARFSTTRIAPYGAVRRGDELLIKEPGGTIVGRVDVDNVLYYEDLDGEALGKLRREYAEDLGVDEAFWEKRKRARYGTILFLKNPRRFVAPITTPRKRDRRPWVVLKNT